MATSYAPLLLQAFDDYAEVLSGGLIYTYEAGTTTPLVTYQDLEGATPNENPVELDAAGRAIVRVTNGVAYKFILTDADGTVITTLDNIIIGEQVTESYEVHMSFIGSQDDASGWMGGITVKRNMTFPNDFAGDGLDAVGHCQTNPAAEQVISIQVNAVEVGTATFDTDGTCYFATTGTTVECVDGDELDFFGPATPGSGADFKIVLLSELT